MTKLQPAYALRQMRALFGLGAVGGLTDEHLLETFSTGHREAAEAAFATLVERHGPMVLHVCRKVLGDSHDVHDAFQATFLVLVRKAGSLWIRDSLGPWLHGVALRVATKAKVAAARRKAHERQAAEIAEPIRVNEYDGHATILHEEIDKLPQKYRAPIVLCYLEGLTHEGAAMTLDWPVGTVHGRLARGRDLLRSRLVRRGLAPSAVTLGALLTSEGASAAPLSEISIRSLMSLVAERSAGLAPAAVVALADGWLRMMTLAKLKMAGMLLLVAFATFGLAEAARLRFPERGHHGKQQPPLLARFDADEPAKPAPPESWPAGVEVSGRVVDHRGTAVAGADVLLLGSERLTVFARPGANDGPVDYNIATQPADSSPSVKTDGQGRFSLRRPGSPGNRIAVVSAQMLLWEISRKEVPDATDLVITLPEPVAMAIHAMIPEKAAKQEFWLTGRLLNRLGRESDSLFYTDIPVPNPGERVVKSLPPAQYEIVRNNFTPLGSTGKLMTQCELRLVPIEPGKRVDVTFDRKTGRRVDGRVRGLENDKLRYALVIISYLGPEERSTPGGKPSRQLTHFDVIPIGPDGRFTTPPLPPNRYEIRLSARHVTTPNQGGQPYDSTGSAAVVVPATGELPPIEIIAEGSGAALADRFKTHDPKEPRLEVRARDEAGLPIKDFAIQLYGPPNSSPDAFGVDGLAVLTGSELKTWNQGELIVSAPGFASTIREFGPVYELRKLDVTLKRGMKIRLRVRDWAGKPIPPALMPLPHVYQSKNRREAWASFMFVDPETRTDTVERTNFLNVRREDDADFAFQIQTDQAEPLYFGFSHPGLLRAFESGPVSASDLAGGLWDVVLPQPATLEAFLKAPHGADEKSPFASGSYSLTPIISGQTGGVPVLEAGTLEAPGWRTTIEHLAPGAYNLHIQTTPSGGKAAAYDQVARVGEFRELRKLALKPGEHASVTFDPPPFNPDAWRGKLSATVNVSPAGERALGGEEYRVSYILPNYGLLPVAQGKLGNEGEIVLENIAPSGTTPFDGQYAVTVAGDYLGRFSVKDQLERQEFPFRMPLRVGDLAADSAAQDLETEQPVRIPGLRGRVVFLEFWATWCGPCREPMQNLVTLGKRRGEAWGNEVALVAVGTDNDREVLHRYVRQNGLTSVRHLWSPQEHTDQASSAYTAYGISQVPTAFLIDRDGRIVWRGHPQSLEVERKIEELLARDR